MSEYPVSRNGRPRIIRRVFKFGKDGRAKIARDRRTRIQMERVKAQVERKCSHPACLRGGIITVGTEFAKLMTPQTRFRGRSWPESYPYHFECVPPDARPLVRFFQPIS